MQLRKVHQQVSLFLFLPLLLTTLTGVAYRIGRSWLGLSKNFGELMMFFHHGQFLGDFLGSLYVIFLGLGVLILSLSGFSLLNKKLIFRQGNVPKLQERRYHQLGGMILFIPLLLTATTGVLYHFSVFGLHLPKENVGWLLSIHQGAYLGATLKPVYILLLGLGVMYMMVTAWKMLSRQRRRTKTVI